MTSYPSLALTGSCQTKKLRYGKEKKKRQIDIIPKSLIYMHRNGNRTQGKQKKKMKTHARYRQARSCCLCQRRILERPKPPPGTSTSGVSTPCNYADNKWKIIHRRSETSRRCRLSLPSNNHTRHPEKKSMLLQYLLIELCNSSNSPSQLTYSPFKRSWWTLKASSRNSCSSFKWTDLRPEATEALGARPA